MHEYCHRVLALLVYCCFLKVLAASISNTSTPVSHGRSLSFNSQFMKVQPCNRTWRHSICEFLLTYCWCTGLQPSPAVAHCHCTTCHLSSLGGHLSSLDGTLSHNLLLSLSLSFSLFIVININIIIVVITNYLFCFPVFLSYFFPLAHSISKSNICILTVVLSSLEFLKSLKLVVKPLFLLVTCSPHSNHSVPTFLSELHCW